MTNDTQGVEPLRVEADIILCRQVVRKLVTQLKFSIVDQTKMITAASELARNTVVYGGGGEMEWEIVTDMLKQGLRLRFRDQGPGIPDMGLALKDGWTSGKGMGLGLSGSKRLVHEFDIESAVGVGTCVSVTRWK
ncbi:anti-sigma regulatory factor [Comamonas endophytica]|uniref:Anti-sigma regulatory factor n=1 Tax=Comamonas endophytica TaxID=2949090 RepID=A0ABY6G7C2_9BURK|nr:MULTISPECIES: anti-sigma regulatory factor [unclassified Acidovorax]MCD2511260.1 anti-sigma regulatory factor [Acidovorax sp. D4N7]UYG50655.1 anti-sigma regulatory factor [Acidovorax sp. 5MLIR]